MNSWRLKLKLWGVRGSIPTPEAQNLGYGGNTSCIEIRLPNDDLVIFDAGSGIRKLGGQLPIGERGCLVERVGQLNCVELRYDVERELRHRVY